MSLYTWELRKLIECSGDELRDLVPFVDYLVGLAEKARSEGLLSLEDEIDTIPDPLVAAALTLIVDGTDPELVRGILEKRIVAGGKRGAELRRELLTLEGILHIQCGDNPSIVRSSLRALLAPEVPPNEPDSPVDAVAILAAQLSKLGEYGPQSGNTALLEDLPQYHTGAIQRILREVDNIMLAKAMRGASSATLKAVMQNMSARAASLLLQDMRYMGAIPEAVVVDCQTRIAEVIARLLAAGEISTGNDLV